MESSQWQPISWAPELLRQKQENPKEQAEGKMNNANEHIKSGLLGKHLCSTSPDQKTSSGFIPVHFLFPELFLSFLCPCCRDPPTEKWPQSKSLGHQNFIQQECVFWMWADSLDPGIVLP